MSCEQRETFRPLSLAQHFDAPEEYSGHFGWLCGYSADSAFLNEAAERFVRLTRPQRAYQGRIALSAVLDPGNPALTLLDNPGVAHIPIKDYANKPFRLLHAKVALLGFRHQENRDRWKVRLLVSTGNWTRQTLEESLDLAWRVEVSSESLVNPDAECEQDCGDIKAAWDLLEWLQELFDTRLFNASANSQPSETMDALRQVVSWIDACSEKAQGRPRVFDNRSASLLSQLPERIKTSGLGPRNYLAMGSGFYEASADQEYLPKIPVIIIKTLRETDLLTARPKADLYVNPLGCQAIATAVAPLQKHGITVRRAATPPLLFGEGGLRSLHAKFLFSASHRDNSNACAHAWVYLGSGNLTHPGFMEKVGPDSGNLEAGVVFAPERLAWRKDESTPENLIVTNLLPIQWTDQTEDTTALSSGSSLEIRDEIYVAPPVAWLTWYDADGLPELRIDEQGSAGFEVLDPSGKTCPRTHSGFQWPEAPPRQVRIKWPALGRQLEALIPVVDQYGRIAATELPSIDIDEAWWLLADFPLPPDTESGDELVDDSNCHKSEDPDRRSQASTTSYPIRRMMELLEGIAAKQTGIAEMDWPLWCNRLEQTMGQTANSATVHYFRELGLNPLSALRHPSFRPTFADTGNSGPGKLYEATLDRIEASWKVGDRKPFGVQDE